MKLFSLLLISLMGVHARGSKTSNDPAPGRSGPPPNLLKSLYAVESQEAYRPSDSSQLPWKNENDVSASSQHNQDEFLSGMSSENVEYIESSENVEREPLGRRSGKLSTFVDDDSAKDDFADSDDDTSSRKCNFSDTSATVQGYVGLGDKIIRKEINYARDSREGTKESRGSLEIDVTHDVLETASSRGGLLWGIIYKVQIFRSKPSEVIDFVIETTLSRRREKIGEFLPGADHNGIKIRDDFYKLKSLVQNKSERKSEFLSSNKYGGVSRKTNDCEKNVIYYNFNSSNEAENYESLSWNWTIRNLGEMPANDSDYVKFRLLYRHRNNRNMYEKIFIFNLLQECSLTLKAQTGWLDSNLIPTGMENCTVGFAKPAASHSNEQQPGLLVKILRLNVPCGGGGFLQFNRTMKMCGKLEEFPHNRRTLYFHSLANTTLSVYSQPTFFIVYKPVDHCYNVTFLERNGSFVIQPTHMALKCHFKIHLPFGNQIKLKLHLTGADAVSAPIARYEDIRRRDGKFSYNDLNFDEFSLSSEVAAVHELGELDECGGVLIEIVNHLNVKWSQCVTKPDDRLGYLLTSPDNMLWIRVTKAHAAESSLSPVISLQYSALPIESIVSQCAFGWISIGQFCMSTFNKFLTWQGAEEFCNDLGGHLPSIQSDTEQHLVDMMLQNSPSYDEHTSYWIGASDKHFEGDYRWIDGTSFSYSRWFPGWPSFDNYNRQPNDDGLSNQDCVEIRRHFNKPASSASFVTSSFMWNDLDCSTENFFICERPMIDEPANSVVLEDCNKTVHLSLDRMKTIITSPGFPRFYSDNLHCTTLVFAPSGFRIMIEFEELFVEHEPQCSYDFVELFELVPKQSQNSSMRHNRVVQKRNKNQMPETSTEERIDMERSMNPRQQKFILQPSNITYNVFTPPPARNHLMPRRMCGDWSSKLKLLRHKTTGNSLGVHFSSDYSHHYSGFKAKISLEKAPSECVDERLKLFNDSCYLVVSFPEVEWVVAQKICSNMGAQLSSVSSLEEQRFIITTVKDSADYRSNSLYWLGAEQSKGSEQMEWTDGTKMSFNGWMLGQESPPVVHSDAICLALQWRTSPSSMVESNLYWTQHRCASVGGYVCKKSRINNVPVQNQTITGVGGRITSPNFPSQYAPSVDYWIKIIAPKRSRVVVQFQKLDIELQNECLYDYVSVQDANLLSSDSHSRLSSERNLLKGGEAISSDYRYDDEGSVYKEEKLALMMSNKQSKRDVKSVTFRDGLPTFQPYIRLCGSHDGDMAKFDFLSRSNEVLLNFHSDYAISGEGFAAQWRSIDISACPGQTFTSREGNLVSPNFPYFLLHNLNCTYVIQAPTGRKVWIEFDSFEIIADAEVHLDLGDGVVFQPYRDAMNIGDGVYASSNEKLKITIRTGPNPRGQGFKVTYRTMPQIDENRVLKLSNATFGSLYHLNYPQAMPSFINYTQHLSVDFGFVISVELHGVQFGKKGCEDSTSIEVFDKYADRNGTFWLLCRADDVPERPVIFITSYLNTIHIRQTSVSTQIGLLNATIRVQPDVNYKLKLITTSDEWVESCHPNPCQFGGKCVVSGKKQVCQCRGHYTGRFCGLTWCDLDPCVFGHCELTNTGFKCSCQAGYMGLTCDQRLKPCNDNPCEGRGECIEKNGGYVCRCYAWFEGMKCEKRMKIPQRPLSDRMLKEPFWLGLITVFVVLAVIGLVWCAKRHFPEKIEKLLQEEADRNRPAHLRHHHHISLREQLQVAGASNNPLMQTGVAQQTVTTPGTQKSLFGRLGIRKPSILSLSSPQPQGSTARTFSLDDLLMPLPRRSPSPRKKRNNSTPTRKNNAENRKILQQLISPNVSSKVTLGELIQLSEKSGNHARKSLDSDSAFTETTFNDRPESSGQKKTLTRQVSSDPKLEKKVTFARLLSKMSAEINHGTDIDGNNHSSALSLPTDVQLRANSVPQSPCTNDIRSPHSTSSNQGSDWSSSELALHEFSLKANNRKYRPKVSSADSILAMFRNFASSNVHNNLPASLIFSPSSSTPTASSPQDDLVGDDESSTSSLPTPVSFSSGAPDSPVFYRQSTIEVPIVDAISAHKSSPTQNMLHPPTILLEIPGSINKCLSPIKELPTPMPSPALTPVMPRHIQRIARTSHDVSYSDDDEKNQNSPNRRRVPIRDITIEPRRRDSDNDSMTASSSNENSASSRRLKLISIPAISIEINPPDEEREFGAQRPTDLVIPELIIETPSPVKERRPIMIFPGSPPPQRASIGETSELFPNKQQKRLMMQFEKPGSLDFPFVPPMITITSNVSEAESDNDFLSPAPLMPAKLMAKAPGMTYLSPFSMCVTQGDRAPSEGNLSSSGYFSSSGYSSMASPGPSRCGSNSKLCSNETDTMSPGINRHQSILKKSDDADKGQTRKEGDEFRKRSDSETLSDETLLESNDEGIGTDHLDEKIEDGEIKSARDLEVFIGKELLEHGKKIMNTEEFVPMSQLQLPTIVIQSEFGFDKPSPMSSRSESPLSDRNNGNGVYSPMFFGKKDQQLPFTDSDGLYDFPSSDGKGGANTSSHHRKSIGKRRERRSSKSNLSQSPPKNPVHLEIPTKAQASNQSTKSPTTTSAARKSPKRRSHRYTPSSSSSNESLTVSTRDGSIQTIKLRGGLIDSLEKKRSENDSDGTDQNASAIPLQPKKSVLPNAPLKKTSRMKAIGNQIRFLRRLERALKEREQSKESSDVDDESDLMSSPKASSPLLATTSKDSRPKAFRNRFLKQRRVASVYTFEPNQKNTLQSSDLLSD